MKHHDRNSWIGLLASAAAAVVLVACGTDQVAGIQGSGAPVASGVTSVGPVTGFGSVFVDGIEYSTTAAQIRIEDQPGAESQLRVGQIVTVRGTLDASGNTGAATELSFTAEVKGPIAPGQIDLVSRTFSVLGQTVRVTDSTLFGDNITPAELESLLAGTFVQVSGFPNAAGEIVASRIDAISSADLQLKGTVQALDATARTFRINSFTVDYSNATVNGTLANASTVVARGTTLGAGGALVAARVQVLGGNAPAANDQGRIEGLITSFTSNADFSVSGQRVVTDSSTVLALQGLTLGVDLPVKVRGAYNASGALVATRVEAKMNQAGIVRGLVDSVSAANNTLTVLGVTITASAATSFEDRSEQRLRQFRLADLRAGDYVEVRGTSNAAGNGLDAAAVQRDRPEARSYVQGVPRNVADPNFTVLGVNVVTNAQTQFAGPGGQAKGREMFFADPGTEVVGVRGTASNGTLIADQVHTRN